MKHKKTTKLYILLSIFFSIFFSAKNIFAIGFAVGISETNVNINVGASKRINVDSADFRGNISVSSVNSSVATIRLLGCDASEFCGIDGKNMILIVKGVASGNTIADVSFSGIIVSTGAQVNETQTIRISVKNSDASLSSLQISPLSINFNKDTFEYTTTADHNVESIDITASATEGSTSVSGTGKFSLKDYLNTFEVTTTAEDGTRNVYKINVKRKDESGRTAASAKKNENGGKKSDDNKLIDILIPGYSIKLEDDVTEYKITVKPDTESLVVRAITSNDKAKVSIEGNNSIEPGENLIKIAVTAENGQIKDYVVRVTRPEDDGTVLVTKDSKKGNLEVLGATTNGGGFNIMPIILTIIGVLAVTGGITGAIFLKKKIQKRSQFSVMRVNSGFRPNSIR